MRFIVIGAGGVGGCFGGELARAGHDVTMFARGAHLEAMRKNGLTVRVPDGEFVARVSATADIEALPDADVAVVAVKSYSLADVIPVVRAAAARVERCGRCGDRSLARGARRELHAQLGHDRGAALPQARHSKRR